MNRYKNEGACKSWQTSETELTEINANKNGYISKQKRI